MVSVAGFLAFLRAYAQIPDTALPDDSPYLVAAYDYSVSVVNLQICGIAPLQYDVAVYHLGTDYLLNWCPDQEGQTYFFDTRKALGLSGFVAGVVASTSDEGTSTSLTVPDFIKNLAMQDLLTLRTPFGRQYMAIAGRSGYDWGLS